jgi:EAL domain-containing protein (putative c-di-GMP-specific phosphodiesterase class I)
VPTVLSALAASRVPAHRLELEITEAVLMQNTEATLKTLHQLRSLGIRISMDDFGTGYSSLSYLRSFPFDKIKIDRCFINGLGDSSESDAIVQAVAGLAMSLSMTTTAEGVETREQLDRVRELGCTDVQGFFYSPPVPMRELAQILAKRQGERVVAA